MYTDCFREYVIFRFFLTRVQLFTVIRIYLMSHFLFGVSLPLGLHVLLQTYNKLMFSAYAYTT
jgi:hypothetical protein